MGVFGGIDGKRGGMIGGMSSMSRGEVSSTYDGRSVVQPCGRKRGRHRQRAQFAWCSLVRGAGEEVGVVSLGRVDECGIRWEGGGGLVVLLVGVFSMS